MTAAGPSAPTTQGPGTGSIQWIGRTVAEAIPHSAEKLAGVDGVGELEKLYREEATRIRASLAARLGDVGLAEELVQDAFIEALEHWRADGVPANPGGWLATIVRRKAIDRLRRERAGQQKLTLLAVTESRRAGPVPLGNRIRLMTCRSSADR